MEIGKNNSKLEDIIRNKIINIIHSPTNELSRYEPDFRYIQRSIKNLENHRYSLDHFNAILEGYRSGLIISKEELDSQLELFLMKSKSFHYH